MGSVYAARHVTLERRFAIKFLLPEYATSVDILRRFENEAKAAGKLEHMHVAAVTDFGRAPDSSPYLVMEYLIGQDCSSLLAKTGPMPVPRAANIAYQTCLGLSVAHQAGIIHRDIKPENIFVQKTGEGEDWVKILDFGIAKLRQFDATAVTATGLAIGTIFYMSPEQIRDSARVDERTDVWSLGVMLYELLANKRPFDGSNVTEAIYKIVQTEAQRIESLRPGLPPPLANAIHKALEKDPAKRFPTAVDLGEAIRPYTNRPSIPPLGANIATDDTVAAEDNRRQASTSQLSASALPRQARSSKQSMWRWPLLGMVIAGLSAWLFDRSVNGRFFTRDPAVAASASISPNAALLASAPIVATSVQVPLSSIPIPTDAKPVVRRPPQSAIVASMVSVKPIPVPAPVKAAVPSKNAVKSTANNGVPITIDANNPF